MKKFLLIVLSLIVVFLLGVMLIFRFAPFQTTDSCVTQVDGGHCCTAISNHQKIAIMTNDAEHFLTISIALDFLPNTVLEWRISDYPEPVFDAQNMEFWEDVVQYAKHHMRDAHIVHFWSSSHTKRFFIWMLLAAVLFIVYKNRKKIVLE